MTLYVIGDIHGQDAMLDTALDRIERDRVPGSEVVFLGDYVDRGPDSRAVLDCLTTGLSEGRNWTCLRGNHDHMFHAFLENGTVTDANIKSGLLWTHYRLGGLDTLRSYGIDADEYSDPDDLHRQAIEAVPAAHRDFLAGLPLYAERGDVLCVHAGIRPGVPLPEQVIDDLIWIRDPFLETKDPHPWLVVHGHTAIKRPTHYGNRINLDAGAGYDRPLKVGVIEGDEVFVLEDKGRVKLPVTPGARRR